MLLAVMVTGIVFAIIMKANNGEWYACAMSIKIPTDLSAAASTYEP